MTDQKNKSKEFTKFEFYFFRDVDLRKDLFVIIDPSTIDDLSEEEKILAEDMLIEALESKLDKRWLIYASAPLPVTASMRRSPAPMLLSLIM